MATAVVTGGAGFIGSHLCEHLLEHGYRVICVDNLETASLENIEHVRDESFRFVNHDVIEPFMIDEEVDVVFHLAAIPSPIDYLRLPLLTLKIGAYGTHNALGLAKWKRARFLLASTSEVYGDPQIHPQPESYWGNVNPVGPRGVYDEGKRYSEAMTMAYHRQQGVDTGIARIFNSILADEQVLFDDGRELRRERISEVATEIATRALAAGYIAGAPPRSLATASDDFTAALEYPLDDVTVPSFTAAGQMIAAPAQSLIAHPTSQRCYEIRTRYGRSIRVTGDHSVFVEGPDGEARPQEANDLRIGDRIAIARRIDVPERDRTEINVIDAWLFGERDPWDLCVEAPGLGQLAWAKRFELFGVLVSERRNAGPNWRNGAWTKLIRMRDTDRLPLPILRRVVEELPADAAVRLRSRGRSVPLPARIAVTDDLLWLLGLWVAEGSWHESDDNGYLTISCDDGLLDRAEAIIRGELGLHVVRAPATEFRSPCVFVHSKLLLRLMEYLGFGGNRKRIPGWILGLPLSRLKWFVEGYREGDGVHSGVRMLRNEHVFTTVDRDLKDDLVVALARFGLFPSIEAYETTFKRRTGDRRYPFFTIGLRNVQPWSPLQWNGGVEQMLNTRCTADLVWAPITAIEEIPGTPLVYDFSVPGTENFWAGTGVMAHNTFGPRMRSSDGRAIPTFMRQAREDKPLTVFGDGSQTRSFCYIDDLISGLYLLAMSKEHSPINLGNPREFTIMELAETVIRVTGSSSEIVHEALPIDDPQIRQPDITLAKEILGWQPEIELEEGLRRMLPSLGREPVSV